MGQVCSTGGLVSSSEDGIGVMGVNGNYRQSDVTVSIIEATAEVSTYEKIRDFFY